ncbi:hypothetical protein V5799_013150 [Amblyomma americanum]|uniref:Uncharacterized protein n=1 Tax=Amblyomma americanum TaxID=6943 RepID=A0AAQ4E6R0_AMBAM
MARSERGVATASVGRDESVSGPPPGHRFLLPTLPSDEEDFRQLLQGAGVFKDISGIGAYHMSHLWLVRFRTQEAKDAVLAAGGLSVKGGYCAIIDPCRKEIMVKIHWVPFHIASETLRKALSEFGEVMEIWHEERNVRGFESAESTTRVARMVLKEGVTAEEQPHLFKFYGGSILMVVPGRAPVRLRCRRRRHNRHDCQKPRCTKSRAFGHVREDSIRTYANVTGAASEDCEDKQDIMDIEEAETTAPDERCKKSVSGEQGSICGGNMKTSSETPKEQGDVSNATETPPISDQASAMNAETEPVQDDRASQDDTSGLAKRAKTMLLPPSQPSTEVRLQRLERQWLRDTEPRGSTCLSLGLRPRLLYAAQGAQINRPFL